MEIMKTGFLQWLPIGNKQLALDTIRDLHALHCTHLRTGFSWADWARTDRENESKMTGKEWFAWLYTLLRKEGIDILPNFLYIPHDEARADSLGVRRTSHPPEDPEEYALFIEEAILAHGDCFEYLEFLNEPHLKQEWNSELDPDWKIYIAMINGAAKMAKKYGKKTVLGGPTAHHLDWLIDRAEQGVLQDIDVVGIHAFQHCKWGDKHSDKSIDQYALDFRKALFRYGFAGELWLTETGYPTAGEDGVSEERQVEIFNSLKDLEHVARTYWWSLADLHPETQSYTESQIGFREESFYHFGIKTWDGKPKLLYRELTEKPKNELAA
jgi:CDP-paratose 2-epimerase